MSRKKVVYLFVLTFLLFSLTGSVLAQEETPTTQITIDGDPSDWEGYEVLITDPEGDYEGGVFDIAAISAFANDQYLYVLIETHAPATDFVHLDLGIITGDRSYVVSFNPNNLDTGWMGDTTDGGWEEVGEVVGGESNIGEAIEYRMPLSMLSDPTTIELGFFPMGGVCCDNPEDWYAIDDVDFVQVPILDEKDPMLTPSGGNLGISETATEGAGPATQICASDLAPPAPFGSFEPLSLQFSEAGYSAEWFIAPAAFNNPEQILISPDENIMINSPNSATLYSLADDGSIQVFAENINGYMGDVDQEGNMYIHSTDGYIKQITPDGQVSFVTQALPKAPGNVGFAIGPDGNFYATQTHFDNSLDDLYQITPSGQVNVVATDIPEIAALTTLPDGRMIGIDSFEGLIYEISMEDFSLTDLGIEPIQWAAGNGLIGDDEGNIYVSTGRAHAGELYKITPNGEITILASFSDCGLSGIRWLPSTGEIVGGQVRTGSVIAVDQEGNQRELVVGNGITTPMSLAFTPCGELVITNDEGGFMGVADPQGIVAPMFDYNSWAPPTSYVAISPEGDIFVSEANPGPASMRVAKLGNGKQIIETYLDADWTIGVAYDLNRGLFVSESADGQITLVKPDGSSEVFASGLNYPQALTLDAAGNLYATMGTAGDTLDAKAPVPFQGDTIVKISPDGEATTLAQFNHVLSAAASPFGDLFVTIGRYGMEGSQIVKISPDGAQTPFASGFKTVIGMAFDLAGNLLVSDWAANGIVRIGGFPQGTLSGVVLDEGGAPVEGARVQVLSVDPIVVGQVVYSDAQGQFSLPAAPRTYTLIVTADGYAEFSLDGVEVHADQETMVDIKLSP